MTCAMNNMTSGLQAATTVSTSAPRIQRRSSHDFKSDVLKRESLDANACKACLA